MIWIIIQILLSISFLFPLFLLIITKIKKKPILHKNQHVPAIFDYGIIVTAYKQVDLIPDVVNSLLNLEYSRYVIYVVADNCDISIINFNNDKVKILQPETILASNTKSHFYAINRFVRKHDVITIIDSDNLVDSGYLNELNHFFANNYVAVQGVRKAKNLNTLYACLDEAGDIYYRYIDRKLLFESGSSASLAGSGMAFTTDIYKKCLAHLNIEGAGFDKVLQYELIKRNERIAFAEKAIVYDEKTTKPDQLVKQRARWINTWFRYWALGVKMLFSSLTDFNWNRFAFSVLLMRPPLFLMLIIVSLLFIVNLWAKPVMSLYWFLILIAFLLVFFISLKHFNANKKIYNSLLHAPKFIFYQILAFFKVRKANKMSVATEHYSTKQQ